MQPSNISSYIDKQAAGYTILCISFSTHIKKEFSNRIIIPKVII